MMTPTRIEAMREDSLGEGELVEELTLDKVILEGLSDEVSLARRPNGEVESVDEEWEEGHFRQREQHRQRL